MSAEDFVQQLITGITQGSIYALIAIGFTVIFGVTNIINFAQGEFMMLGGMISFVLLDSLGFAVAPAAILAIVIVTAIGVLLYLLGIRTARKASPVSLIIITIGAATFIRGVSGELWGKDWEVPPFFTGDHKFHVMGATNIHVQAIWIIGITVVVTIVLYFFFSRTMLGKALKGSAVSPVAAGMVGIDVKKMALFSFALAAALGAIAGVAYAPLYFISYQDGVMLGLKGFTAASLGGFKSQLAAVGGGIMLGVVESVSIGIDWGPFTSQYKDVIALVVLLAVLLVRSGRLAAEEKTS